MSHAVASPNVGKDNTHSIFGPQEVTQEQDRIRAKYV